VPDPVLTLLKYVFLAILYLFFLRVLRAVWVELREPKPSPSPPAVDPTQVPLGYPQPAPPVTTPGAWPVASGHPGGPATSGSSGASDPTVAGAVVSLQPAAKLVVVAPGDREGREFTLGDEVTVGRAGGCAVLLADDTFVSQLHARIFRRDGDLYVEDLGSTNGTYLNQRKVGSATVMHSGDRVQFGRTTLELRE
jgi:hypothetical protein